VRSSICRFYSKDDVAEAWSALFKIKVGFDRGVVGPSECPRNGVGRLIEVLLDSEIARSLRRLTGFNRTFKRPTGTSLGSFYSIFALCIFKTRRGYDKVRSRNRGGLVSRNATPITIKFFRLFDFRVAFLRWRILKSYPT
jgi:hypothetical protein